MQNTNFIITPKNALALETKMLFSILTWGRPEICTETTEHSLCKILHSIPTVYSIVVMRSDLITPRWWHRLLPVWDTPPWAGTGGGVSATPTARQPEAQAHLERGSNEQFPDMTLNDDLRLSRISNKAQKKFVSRTQSHAVCPDARAVWSIKIYPNQDQSVCTIWIQIVQIYPSNYVNKFIRYVGLWGYDVTNNKLCWYVVKQKPKYLTKEWSPEPQIDNRETRRVWKFIQQL